MAAAPRRPTGSGRILSVAEETGLIVPIGKWVLLAACRQAALELPVRRQSAIAVNLSARQFRGAQLVNTVKEVLREQGLEPHISSSRLPRAWRCRISSTVSTSCQVEGYGRSSGARRFRRGFSSLGSLKRFPIDLLKIDRSFVHGLPDDQESVVITRAIVSMAHRLQLTVLAEGVGNSSPVAVPAFDWL